MNDLRLRIEKLKEKYQELEMEKNAIEQEVEALEKEADNKKLQTFGLTLGDRIAVDNEIMSSLLKTSVGNNAMANIGTVLIISSISHTSENSFLVWCQKEFSTWCFPLEPKTLSNAKRNQSGKSS